MHKNCPKEQGCYPLNGFEDLSITCFEFRISGLTFEAIEMDRDGLRGSNKSVEKLQRLPDFGLVKPAFPDSEHKANHDGYFMRLREEQTHCKQ